jgi:hypothetical protein
MQHRLRKPCHASLLMILLGLVLVAFAMPAHAAGMEETVALNFLQFLRSDKRILAAEVLDGNRLDPALPPVTVGHLFHLDGGGYLLVSPDRSISPVKAYSLTGDFPALPEPYRRAVLMELELRARVALAGTRRTPLSTELAETEARWDFLLGFDSARMPLDAYVPGTNLLQTRWNQGYPYNKFLPAVGGQTVWAGCVNVALAQVMRYHQHPASGKDVVFYTWTPSPPPPPEPPWSAQTLKTSLMHKFNWANMAESVDAATPGYQADEVALLIRDLGIANRTHFGVAASSASLRSEVLIENFGYSTGLATMDNKLENFVNFHNTIRSQIQAGQPVLLTFPGHMTVADGYVADGTGWKVHVNMGWGGYKDNFYFLDRNESVQQFSTDAGNLDIHYNIKPCNAAIAGDCAAVNPPLYDNGSITIAGDFKSTGDTRDYTVYLSGPTTLAATRGYNGGVYFYISLFNTADGSEVFVLPDPATSPANSPIQVGGTEGLPSGKYIVRISLCRATSCFLPDDGFNHYNVTLATGILAEEQKAAIDQALDRPPVIGSVSPDLPLPDLLLSTSQPAIQRILIDARDENGDAVSLSVRNSNPAAVDAVLAGNILELTVKGAAKVSSRIVVTGLRHKCG